LQERCEVAYRIFTCRNELRKTSILKKEYYIALSAGTAHLPQLINSKGLPVWESFVTANYLAQKGIPTDRIFIETTSYDTIGNALFLRLFHTDLRNWRNLLILTSEFHMPRSKAIFDWVFALPLAPHGRKDEHHDWKYRLHYLATKNVGLSEEALASRVEREKESLNAVLNLQNTLTSLEDLHNWMTQQHSFYSYVKMAAKSSSNLDEVSSAIKKSYGAVVAPKVKNE